MSDKALTRGPRFAPQGREGDVMRMRLRNNRLYLPFFLPSLLGMLVFYLLPYVASLYYALTDAAGGFVGMANIRDVFTSSSFLAVGNTTRFMLVCVPLCMSLSKYNHSISIDNELVKMRRGRSCRNN